MIEVKFRAKSWDIDGAVGEDEPEVSLIEPENLLEQELLRDWLIRQLKDQWMAQRPTDLPDRLAASFDACLADWVEHARGPWYAFRLEENVSARPPNEEGGGADGRIYLAMRVFFEPRGVHLARPEYYFYLCWFAEEVAGAVGPWGSDDARSLLASMYKDWYARFGCSLHGQADGSDDQGALLA